MKKPAESNESSLESSSNEPARAIHKRPYVAPRLERKRAVEPVSYTHLTLPTSDLV